MTETTESAIVLFEKLGYQSGKLRDTLLPKLMSGEVRVDYEH